MNSMQTMKTRMRLLPAILVALATVPAALAQDFPFSMQYTQGAVTTPVVNNSVVTLAAPLGLSQTLQIRATYTGIGSVSITELPAISGSNEFTATISQSLPITLATDQSFVFTVRYAPASANAAAAQLVVPFSETPTTTITPIVLSLRGVTSAIVVSYSLPVDNNTIPLQNGATIPFPQTLVGTVAPATLSFTNIGTTTGQVTRVSVTGDAFGLQGLPLLPATLLGGTSLQMQVVYKPTVAGSATGTLTVETSSGVAGTYNSDRLGDRARAFL